MTINFNPVLLEIGSIKIYWYGVMYAISFIIAAIYLSKAFRDFNTQQKLPLSKDIVFDILFYALLGIVIGGRLGFILFYNLSYFIENPIKIFAIYEGGLSFHGGILGILFFETLYMLKNNLSFDSIADIAVVIAPVGLFFGRIGNFINGELFGRPSHVAWVMKFPKYGGDILRHPSQLYEAVFEGIILFIILFFLKRYQTQNPKKIPQGTVFWTFFTLYGIFRFTLEYFREPDIYWGHSGLFWGLSMGQILSFPMIVIGGYFLGSLFLKHRNI